MRLRKRRREVRNPEGETTSESPDSSPSSSPLPPGPTARWIWLCDNCRKSFIAWVMPAVDASGREHLYVWDYELDPSQHGTGGSRHWKEVQEGVPPPCVQCGGDKTRGIGPQKLGGDLRIAYEAMKRLLKQEEHRGRKAWLRRTENYSKETWNKLEKPAWLFNHVPDCTCDECKDARLDRERDVPDGA